MLQLSFDSPPSYDSPLPDVGGGPSEAGPSSFNPSRSFSTSALSLPPGLKPDAGIKPEAAAAHYAWNASLNALDPEKKFVCPMPSCGRGAPPLLALLS